ADNLDDLVVLDVVGELTADAAVWADRIDPFVGHDLRRVLGRCERAGGAGLHAFAAGHAGGVAHGVVHVEDDFRMTATEGVADDVVDLLLATGTYAARALDTGVEIDGNGWIGQVGVGRQARCEARAGYAHFLGPVGQLVVGLVVLRRHVGQQQLQHHLLGSLGAFAHAADFHVGPGCAAARRRQHALAPDLDHAGTAIAIGPHAFHVAQMRNLDAVALGGLDDGFAFESLDLVAIETESDRICDYMWSVHGRSYFSSSGKYFITHCSGLGAA